MLFPRNGLIFGGRARVHSAFSTVVTHAIVCRVVIDDGGVVDVANVRDVYVVNRAVVVKTVVIPAAALVALAKIAVAIIDAAVEADLRRPISFVKEKPVAVPCPITWGPEQAGLRRHHPGTGHPVVVVVIVVVCPVAWRPNVSVGWARRLCVYGQCGWTKTDRKRDLRDRSRGKR